MKDSVIRNPYKRTDVFRCLHPSHSLFHHRVSPYHVLKRKRCFPQGCLYFDWHCSLMEKGSRCIHGYQYVGKNCKGCTYYLEEKYNFQPECCLSPADYQAFLAETETFDTWLEEGEHKRFACSGRIQSVKPLFELACSHQQKQRLFKGYLLVFKRGYIGNQLFDDFLYVRISESQMARHRFISRMKLEFTAEVRFDGRLVLFFPKSIEILTRGWGYHWTRSKALVALKTGTLLEHQSEQCLACTWSLLMDVRDDESSESYRKLHCMKGVRQPEVCSFAVFQRVRKKMKKHSGVE